MDSINVLSEILEWSTDRPGWQRDALRRMVVQGELTEKDVTELSELCKASKGLRDKLRTEPLAEGHLPNASQAESAVQLTALTHNKGVNALAPDQTLEFGPALTVVYGANAAGKSGYTRILKRACRARGAEEVLGNVVSEGAPGRPSATLRFQVGSDRHEYTWDDERPVDQFLSRVSVFDRHCASVYISEQTDVAFRPLGLDLFDKLSNVCEAVRRTLEKERKDIEASALHLPDVHEGTAVHEALSHITSLTDPEQIRRLSTLSEKEIAHLEELRKRTRDLQSDDPLRRAKALELRAKRVDQLANAVEKAYEMLSTDAVSSMFAAHARMIETKELAEQMRRDAFLQQPVPNTGSDAWRSLWSAAETFSIADAYPDEPFPFLEANARCPLCQQVLRDDAVDRFRRFYEFLNSDIQQERDEASVRFDRIRVRLATFQVIDESTAQAIEEVRLEFSDLAESVAAALDTAKHRRLAVLNSLAESRHEVGDLPQLPDAPSGLAESAERLRTRSRELQQDMDPAVLHAVQSELRELESREVLARHVQAVLGEIERQKRLAAYQLCLDETRTNAITRKSSEVTMRAVTDQLAASFRHELKELNFRDVEVEMVPSGGSRGSLYHRLQLRRAPGVSVPKVVSEGEARCLSIASFFAELSTADDHSAILFDDPVSSLDHEWRENVAARLVKEAKSRQVIVFTHDIVFLVELAEQSVKQDVVVTNWNLKRGYTTAGISEPGPPYPGMKVTDRVGYLRTLLQEAVALYRAEKPTEYEIATTRIYGLLRKAWERGVEELLLYGVVERYRNSVQTSRARRLMDITDDDCKALEAGMTKTSEWEGGHDHAKALGKRFPDPDEVKEDIEALATWVKGLKKRRN